jgi:mannose-6-phosphate isomerase-like protein (cupin superfamily)
MKALSKVKVSVLDVGSRAVPIKITAKKPVEVSADIRRTISEVNDSENDYSVQFFKVQEQIPLGNHYHVRKYEVFLVLKGEGGLYVQTLTKAAEKVGGMRRVSIQAPCVVRIPPLVAHAFLLSPGSEMICYSSKAYDQSDLHPYPLLKIGA